MSNYFAKVKTINKVVLLEVDKIRPNKAQPRIVFDENEIKSLSDSIVKNGLLQPLTVREYEDYYELISGERRLRALKMAGIASAPSIIVDTTDRQSAVFALLENLQRTDLNYFEEAFALKNMIVEWGISQQELGEKLGKSQPAIANKLRLLKYSDDIQKLMLEKSLNERQARALLKITDKDKLIKVIDYISEKKLNVAETEKYIEKLLEKCEQKPKKKYQPVVKDVRLFLNTINNAISLMNQSGINASTKKIESSDCIEYIVRIPIAN